MAKKDLETRFDQVRESITTKKQKSKFQRLVKKCLVYGIPISIVGGIPLAYLASDYYLKRQDYPERNIIYSVDENIKVSGSFEEKGVKQVNIRSETTVREGGRADRSIAGTNYCEMTREQEDAIEKFILENPKNERVASAAMRPEKVQSGLNIAGSITFKEELGEIFLADGHKSPQKYILDEFVPERGSKEIGVTVIEHEDGKREVQNCLTDKRTFLVGWLWGREFRAGTTLEEYLTDLKSEDLKNQFTQKVRLFNSGQLVSAKEREKLIREAINIERQIPRKNIYSTFESGIIDLMPQGSFIYLGYEPTLGQRLKNRIGLEREVGNLLVVKNYWNLIPGRVIFLDKLHFGNEPDVIYPFDKVNNGGYLIKDKFGSLAKINIKDFIFRYGRDVLYSYYLDLDGNGQIDTKKEKLGDVLVRITHDDKIELEHIVGKGKPKTDISFNLHYSFMSSTQDLDKGLGLFYLCGYLESLIPDVLNRGYGKHSMIGFINQQRSDIMLYNHLNSPNMSRALTEESALTAKHDIVKVLIEADRPYARKIAAHYGIENQYADRFNDNNLPIRQDYGPIPAVFGISLGSVGLYSYLKIKKKKEKKKLRDHIEQSISENS